jgi:hypothetical protein
MSQGVRCNAVKISMAASGCKGGVAVLAVLAVLIGLKVLPYRFRNT